MPLNSLLRSSTFQALFERVASSVGIVVSRGEARVDDSKEVRSARLASQIMANILEEDEYCNESGIDRKEKYGRKWNDCQSNTMDGKHLII
jgi:hypothetical protein